jgi:hypothetical protein
MMTCQEQIFRGRFILLFFTKSSKKFDLNPHDLFRTAFDKTGRDQSLSYPRATIDGRNLGVLISPFSPRLDMVVGLETAHIAARL